MPDVALVLGLLSAVAVLAAISRRAGLPDPIVFALGGVALALIPGIPVVTLPPALVLVVFLPPLIFAAAQDTSWAELRGEALPILVLAVGLVLVTMAAVAVVAHALAPELTWAAAFTLGAIVAPPDTVAAKAVADTLRLPRRLVAILGGEGLVNDATALIAFQVASGIAVAGTTFAAAPAVGRAVYAAVAAIAIGIAVGWIGRQILTRAADAAVENTVALLMPFGAFLPAEAVHASGVVAVVTLALYLSRFSASLASSASRLQGRVLWEMIDFLLTGLSFILVGLQLRVAATGLFDRPGHVLLTTGAVCLTVVVVRPAWVFATAWLSHSVLAILGERLATDRPTAPALFVLGWAGMRGVISLAVALSIPRLTAAGGPFPGRDLIVFITFGVIVVTLIGQGLTLPAIVRRSGVAATADRTYAGEIATQLRMARAALHALDDVASAIGAAPDVVERMRGIYAERIERIERHHVLSTSSAAVHADEARARGAARVLVERLLDVERGELQRMQNDAAVDHRIARQLLRELDLQRVQGRARHRGNDETHHG